MAKTYQLGTISGRHPLPVEEYIVNVEVNPGQGAYDTAYESARDWAGRTFPLYGKGIETVELYFTGLTELTLGALDGLESVGINVIPMRFDAPNQSYVPLRRKPGGMATLLQAVKEMTSHGSFEVEAHLHDVHLHVCGCKPDPRGWGCTDKS